MLLNVYLKETPSESSSMKERLFFPDWDKSQMSSDLNEEMSLKEKKSLEYKM